VVFVLTLLIVAPFGQASVGKDNTLAVFITFEPDVYPTDSEVEVYVHTFKKGEYYDPTEVSLKVLEDGRALDLEWVSTGSYRTSYVVREEDASFLWYIGLKAEVYAIGPDGGSAIDVVHIETEWIREPQKRFTLDVVVPDIGDLYPSPGQAIEFEVHCKYGGVYVNPTPGTLESKARDPDYVTRRIILDTVSTGLFRGTYVLPSTLTTNTRYRISASAEFEADNDTKSDWDYFYVHIDHYEVWAHYLNITPTWTDLEVYVTDLANKPIAGATVTMTFNYYDLTIERREGSASATTDAEGKAHVVLNYPDLAELSDYIGIRGRVTADGLTQTFSDNLVVKEVEFPYYWPELDLVIKNDFFIKPNMLVDLELQALYNGTPLADKEVYIYIRSDSTLYEHTGGRTNAEGVLVVPFRAPGLEELPGSHGIWVYMQINIDGVWDWDVDVLIVSSSGIESEASQYVDPRMDITVEPFKIGGQVNVTVTHPNADGIAELGTVMWWLSDAEGNPLDYEETWESWSESFEMWGTRMYACTWNGASYVTSFNFPIFMPEDIYVTFYGMVIFNETGGEEVIKGIYRMAVMPLPPDPLPTISVTYPREGDFCNGTMDISGTASAFTSVEWVELRIDDSDWVMAEGTTDWRYEIDTTQIARGTHMFLVRCFDGRRYSEITQLFFEVDQEPSLQITSPENGTSFWDVATFEGTAGDDLAIEIVEYRLDEGQWTAANGLNLWEFRIDTSNLSSGEHKVEVRCRDCARSTPVQTRTWTVDHSPELEMTVHPGGRKVSGTVEFAGTTSDDNSVMRVEIRMDGGGWIVIEGTDTWSHSYSAKGLPEGAHTLEARAFDGYTYSAIASTSFVVVHKTDEGPGFGPLGAISGLLAASVFLHLRSRRRRGDGRH
jgi:hypothetical protein